MMDFFIGKSLLLGPTTSRSLRAVARLRAAQPLFGGALFHANVV